MNQYEITLLEQAYDNYKKTGEATGRTLGRNGDEVSYYFNALNSLITKGLVAPTSDDFDPDRLTIPNVHVDYALTRLGLDYASKELWELSFNGKDNTIENCLFFASM